MHIVKFHIIGIKIYIAYLTVIYARKIFLLHHDVAGALMNGGRIQDAEKHLLKAMQIGVRGAGDYIDVHGPRNI